MRKQIRNIANAYILIIGMVLLLLLSITVRVVDIYYNDDMKQVLEKRVYQLESIYTNYTEAGLVLKELNDNYVDSVLYTRLEGILDLTRDSVPQSPDITSDYKRIFGKLENQKIDIVEADKYNRFMTKTYGLDIEGTESEIVYHNAFLAGERWRLVTKYIEEKNAVIVVAENVSDMDIIRSNFKSDIEKRIQEHMGREPKDVYLMLVNADGTVLYCSNNNCNHVILEQIDIMTGQPLMDLIKTMENGEFEYQLSKEDGYKEYFAFTRKSKEYDAHILLSMEKDQLANRLGYYADLFFKGLMVLMIILSIWTGLRFKAVLGTGFSYKRLKEDKKHSQF